MSSSPESIAIIGLAARLPGAIDVYQYWRNLRAGVESVSCLSDEELVAFGVARASLEDSAYVRAVPLVPRLHDFDAEFFGMTARDAQVCDPQLKLFLEVSHAALEDAGIDARNIPGDVGVFGSGGQPRYSDLYVYGRLQHADPSVVVLNNSDYVSTFTSYKLDLRGPALTVMTACSSSLVGVHLACQSLLLGECDLAIAGGANVELPYGHGYRWSPGSVRARDGHCRPFDAAAGGTVFGNGAGAVLLKRLSDAVANGDYIRAVIHGSALNNDGSAKMSFGAPSLERQAEAVVQAMTVAGRAPSDISYIEAHGTGTAVGDPVEVAALARAYSAMQGGPLPGGSIPIGSVKGNIGHTVASAGVASLIKLALALEHEEIPPNINFRSPNPALELDKTPFFVNDELRPWPRTADRARWAGISALGVGGTNAHVIVGEGPVRKTVPSDGRSRIVIWSGRTPAAADAAKDRLADYFADCDAERFADAVATLAQGRTPQRVRGAVLAGDPAEFARALREGVGVIAPQAGDPVERTVAFLLPGQGSQHVRMASGLYGRQRVFTEAMDCCLDQIGEVDGGVIAKRWQEADEDFLNQTQNAQPLLFAVEYATARLLSDWGVDPAVLLGHSVGELAAATLAGVLDVESAIRLTALRGRAMQQQPEGVMQAVRGTVDMVRPLLPPGVFVAVVNGPDQVVIAGPAAAVTEAADRLAGQGLTSRRLSTSHAFHGPAMAGATEEFLAGFAGVELRPPSVPVYSAVTGEPLRPEEATNPRFWVDQIIQPVRFDLALDALLKAGDHLLVEIGPGRALTTVARRHPAVRDGRSIALTSLASQGSGARDDERAVQETVATLWVNGAAPRWAALNGPARRVPVPGYPYQRKRHWVDPTTGPAAVGAVTELNPQPTPEVTSEVVAATFSTTTWIEQAPAGAELPSPGGVCALAQLPADQSKALDLIIALQQCGYDVIRVRPDDAFAVANGEFRVRPGVEADLERVMEELRAAGRHPQVLVHAWAAEKWAPVTVETAEEQLRASFHGLQALVKVAGRKPVDGMLPTVLVLTIDAVDVSGSERVDPVKATLLGHVRTLIAETPGLSCRLVDLGDTAEEEIVGELSRPTREPVVALRGSRRWVPRERAYAIGSGSSPIRRDGVYLVTGGLGGLGLEVAKGLAGTGLRPTIVLVGRTGVPEGERAHSVRAAIEEMEMRGAKVRVHAGDIGDPRAVARILDITAAKYGPITGVLHLAGVAGDGLLQFRSAAAADGVFRPKVLGTLVLQEAFVSRPPLEFFVSFSSRAAWSGLVGSGDYAAANAFLDAHSHQGDRRLGRRLSIGWPAWNTVGMAAPHLPDRSDDGVETRHFTVGLAGNTDWPLDEHRLDGLPILPATGHLDLLVRAFREVGDGGPNSGLVIEDVVFTQPLVADAAREAVVALTRAGERWRFQIASRPAEGEGELVEHVSGYIAAGDRAARTVPLAELRDGLTEREIPPLTAGAERMFTLGPRWRNLSRMWSSDDVKLVHLTLPSPFAADLRHHPLHPAMLDGATASIRDPERDGLHLPFMYRRLVLHASLPAELYSHIRRRAGSPGMIVGDIDLVAADGTVVAEIEGFTMRHVERDSFANKASPQHRQTPRGPAASGTGLNPASGTGLNPDQGVRLLLDLLGARTPDYVGVRPHDAGRPEPITALEPSAEPPSSQTADAPVPQPAPSVTATASLEDQVRAFWREALGAEDIPDDADFFELGGDSLSAVQLMSRIRDFYQIEFSPGALFDYPKLSQLADALRDSGVG